KWLALIDTDEFLVPVIASTLPELLNAYAEYGGLCVNSQAFGTSGMARIPEGQLLIETLTRCAPRDHPYNLHVRSIVQPARVTGCHNPHYVEYGSGHVQVNADKLPFDGPFAPYVACEAIRANHYWTRDEWYFYNCKLPRSRRAGFYRPNALV